MKKIHIFALGAVDLLPHLELEHVTVFFFFGMAFSVRQEDHEKTSL